METTLEKLPINKIGKIIDLKVNDGIKRRLFDLGLIKNTNIKKLYEAPLKDPAAYLIRGSVIALRLEDAKKIIIEMEDK